MYFKLKMGIVQCHVSFQWCILAFGKTKHFFVSIKTDDLSELVVFPRKLGFQPKKSSWWFSSTTGKNWCLGALESGKSQDSRNPNHQDPNHLEPDGHPFFSWLFLWDDEPIFSRRNGWKWPFPSTFKLVGNGVPGNLPLVVQIQKDAEKTAPRYLLTSYRHASRH